MKTRLREISLNGNPVFIDSDFSDLIEFLNALGYPTDFCCSGTRADHPDDPKFVSEPHHPYWRAYISFVIDPDSDLALYLRESAALVGLSSEVSPRKRVVIRTPFDFAYRDDNAVLTESAQDLAHLRTWSNFLTALRFRLRNRRDRELPVFLDDTLAFVDADFVVFVRTLNERGYRTRYCCSATKADHLENPIPYYHAYIAFVADLDSKQRENLREAAIESGLTYETAPSEVVVVSTPVNVPYTYDAEHLEVWRRFTENLLAN